MQVCPGWSSVFSLIAPPMTLLHPRSLLSRVLKVHPDLARAHGCCIFIFVQRQSMPFPPKSTHHRDKHNGDSMSVILLNQMQVYGIMKDYYGDLEE